MKKILFILSVFITTNAGGQDKHDIRSVNWGWSVTQVKASEKLKLLGQKPNRIMYEGTLNNKDFVIIYDFINNKLVRATYIEEEKYINSNNYIEDYNGLKELLTKKYDNPSTDTTIWSDNLYKDKPEDVGLACSAGHVKFKSRWVSDNTIIDLVCTGENFKINLGIVYTSLRLKSLIDSETNSSNTKDF